MNISPQTLFLYGGLGLTAGYFLKENTLQSVSQWVIIGGSLWWILQDVLHIL